MTVQSSSGNLDILGNFCVNTNKFNVNASSGNTNIAGTLNVTGILVLLNFMMEIYTC